MSRRKYSVVSKSLTDKWEPETRRQAGKFRLAEVLSVVKYWQSKKMWRHLFILTRMVTADINVRAPMVDTE